MKTSLIAFSLTAMSFASFATPHVTQTTMVQDARTRRVTIGYTLDEPAVVTLDVQTNRGDGVFCSIGREPLRNVSGDINCLVRTVNTPIEIHWQPDLYWQLGKKLPDGSVKAVVTAWATNAPPDYMVFDLRGVDCTRYYESEADLPYPITNDCYKTDYLVMKKVHAADVNWRMGSLTDEPGRPTDWTKNMESPRIVTLTADYYLGVYEFTAAQYRKLVWSGWQTSVDGRRPAYISYETLRGLRSNNIIWPTTGHKVGSGNNLGVLRTKLGIEVDLPTGAQWEYACRADTTTAYYNGKDSMTDDEAKAFCWSALNATETQFVGLKPANPWGFYDMAGNAAEWVLDYMTATVDLATLSRVDPVGEPDGGESNMRTLRGGSWNNGVYRSAEWWRGIGENNSVAYVGFRLCAPAAASSK